MSLAEQLKAALDAARKAIEAGDMDAAKTHRETAEGIAARIK